MNEDLQQLISAFMAQNNPQTSATPATQSQQMYNAPVMASPAASTPNAVTSAFGGGNNTPANGGGGWDSMQGKGGMALGGFNALLGGLNYLDTNKLNKKRGNLLDQQIANNAQVMANRTADREQVRTAFGA